MILKLRTLAPPLKALYKRFNDKLPRVQKYFADLLTGAKHQEHDGSPPSKSVNVALIQINWHR